MRVKFKNNSSIGFNTQPRGGGCTGTADNIADLLKFQHTAARRRLHHVKSTSVHPYLVSTHSRAEAAAEVINDLGLSDKVSTHSRAEAAANVIKFVLNAGDVSTHSRAEAAA